MCSASLLVGGMDGSWANATTASKSLRTSLRQFANLLFRVVGVALAQPFHPRDERLDRRLIRRLPGVDAPDQPLQREAEPFAEPLRGGAVELLHQRLALANQMGETALTPRVGAVRLVSVRHEHALEGVADQPEEHLGLAAADHEHNRVLAGDHPHPEEGQLLEPRRFIHVDDVRLLEFGEKLLDDGFRGEAVLVDASIDRRRSEFQLELRPEEVLYPRARHAIFDRQ